MLVRVMIVAVVLLGLGQHAFVNTGVAVTGPTCWNV
jgi:hypothetical protein